MEKTIGLIGLGKMGYNIGLQMMKRGYTVVAFNRSPGPVQEIAKAGAKPAKSVEDLVKQLGSGQKVVWLMLPAGQVTTDHVEILAKVLKKGDVVIDGSNGYFRDDIKHNAILGAKGVLLLDAGCSGGPSGALNGMCTMVGGDKAEFKKLEKLFTDLSVKNGVAYIGGIGSGHFVKMVHNAVEYGMMQSIAEGVELMRSGPFEGLNLADILKLWNNGSVVESKLVMLSERAVRKNPDLEKVVPYVEDNGEGRWSTMLAIEYGIPFGSIANSIFNRFSSRDENQYGRKFLAALRHEFGGHAVKTEEK